MKQFASTMDDVAIVGLGLRLPGGSNTPEEFWSSLCAGLDGITRVEAERWSESFYKQGYIASDRGGYIKMKEWTDFDPLHFGILPKEAACMDPQIRVFLKCVWEALEDAHIKPESIRGSNSGVFLGQMHNAFMRFQEQNITDINPNSLYGNVFSFSCARVNYVFDLRGPSLTVDVACASSLNCIMMGVEAIREGRSDLVIAGGSNGLFDPKDTIDYTNHNMLSPTGASHSFDASADGYARGEGVACVILKKLSKAIEDGDNIYCVVKGGSNNCDGSFEKQTITAPSGASQQENIRLAFKNSNLNPKDIYYIECHGTGTPVGDPIELNALSEIFKRDMDNPLFIGSVKSNIGHTESTAGVASAIKCALMLKHRKLVPNIRFSQPNPKINLDQWNFKIVTQCQDFPKYNEQNKIKIGINSFGLSGSNSHLILEEYHHPQVDKQRNSNSMDYLIPFSASTGNSIDSYIHSINNKIGELKSRVEFSDFVKYQVLSKSTHPFCRSVVSARDWDDFLKITTEESPDPQRFMKSKSNIQSNTSTKTSEIPVVMVFCGQGSQYSEMGRTLSGIPEFKEALDYADSVFAKYFGYSVMDKFYSSSNTSDPVTASPSIFIFQYALVSLYRSWGIFPTMAIGHSFGDITAAWCANIISLDTAARVIYLRSTKQNSLVGDNRMLAVSLSEEEYSKRYAERYPSIEVSCYNSHDSIVVGGDKHILEEIAKDLKESNVFSAFLSSPVAYHTSSMQCLEEWFFSSELARMRIAKDGSQPTLPFFSCHLKDRLASLDDYNVKYIFDNVRQPVYFADTVGKIVEYIEKDCFAKNGGNKAIFLEIAPHSTLSFYLKSLLPKSSPKFNALLLSPMNKKKNEINSFKESISTMFCFGYNVDFSSQFDEDHVSYKESTRLLPRYQWDDQYYWFEQPEWKKIRAGGVTTTLLGFQEENLGTYESVIDINRPAYDFLKGHRVKGKCLFPGAGYIDNIINAFSGQNVHLHSLQFTKPVFLKEGEKCKLKSIFTRILPDQYTVSFNYLDPSSQSWIESAEGSFSVTQPTSMDASEKTTAHDLIQQTNIRLAKDEVYRKINLFGLPYGPSFQRVEEIYIGDTVCIAKVNCSPQSKLQERTLFNASVLDCLFHSIIPLISAQMSEIVFKDIEGVTIYQQNFPEERPEFIYSVTKEMTYSNNIVNGVIDFILEDGTVLVSIDRERLQSLGGVITENLEAKYPKNYICTSSDQPKVSPMIYSIVDPSSHFSIQKSADQRRVFRVLDLNDDANQTISQINTIRQKLVNDSSIFIDYVIVCTEESQNQILTDKDTPHFTLKFFTQLSLPKNLLEIGILQSSFDLILTNIETFGNYSEEYYKLLSPNGQLLLNTTVPDDSKFPLGLYKSKETTEFTVYAKPESPDTTITYDKIIFLFDEQSPDNVQFEEKLVKESDQFTRSVSVYRCAQLMSSNFQESLVREIQESSNPLILYLANTCDYNNDNFPLRSMEYLKVFQMIFNHKLQAKVLLVSVDGYLKSSLTTWNREFSNEIPVIPAAVHISSKDLLQHLDLSYLLQLSDQSFYGDSYFIIKKNLSGLPEIMVTRTFKDPSLFDNQIPESQIMKIISTSGGFKVKNGQRSITIPENHVEVEVMYSSISSRDSNDVSPVGDSVDKYHPSIIGFESSGTISKSSSKHFAVGDRVVVRSQSTLSSQLVTSEENVFKIPAQISYSDALSLVNNYYSVFYTFTKKVRLDNDDSILIHDGHTGIGKACLNYLKSKSFSGVVIVDGIETQRQEQYIQSNYKFVKSIIHKTSTNPLQEIKNQTKGRGVDVVLLSAAKPISQLDFDSVSKNGQIVEITGTQSKNIQLIPKTISHITVNISEDLKPSLIQSIFADQNICYPAVKEYSNAKEAIESVETPSGKKIIINMTRALKKEDNDTRNQIFKDNAIEGTFLITGQTGLGLKYLEYFMKTSTTRLTDVIILSKSPMRWEYQLLAKKQDRINVHFRQCDIGDLNSLRSTMRELTNSGVPPVKSILHLANVFSAVDMNLSYETFSKDLGQKAFGAINLHQLSIELDWKLNHFVLFSSVSSILKNFDIIYGFTNCLLDDLAHYRRSIGLEATSINYGPIDSAGALANNLAFKVHITSNGHVLMSLANSIGALRECFRHPSSPVTQYHVMKFDFPQIYTVLSSYRWRYEHLVSNQEILDQRKQSSHSFSSQDELDSIPTKIINQISETLSIHSSKLNLDTPLKEFGVDSLISTQLKSWIDTEFKQNIVTQTLISHSSINKLIEIVNNSK